MGVNFDSILSPLQDELKVLIFVANADHLMSTSTVEIISHYAAERAKDKRLYFDEEVARYALNWINGQRPSATELPGSLARIRKAGDDGIRSVLEVGSILIQLDDKISPGAKIQLAEVFSLIRSYL